MFGGDATLPLTITTAGGAGLSAAAQHSQSLEALLCHIPGLKVVYPSNPYDMKGLMAACIREDNPTVMIKHKRLLGMQRRWCRRSAYAIPLGVANVAARRATTSPSSPGADGQRGAGRRRAARRRRHRLRGDRPAHAAAARHRHRRRVGAQDQPRRRRPRGGALRRLRCRGRRADPGGRVRLPRRAGRAGRRAVLAGAVHARRSRQHYVPDAGGIAAGIRDGVGPPAAEPR